MIHSGIIIDAYINYWQYVKRLQEFLYRNFKIMNVIKKCNLIVIKTAKTHKFGNLEDIPVVNLKFRPIIDQAATFTYSAAKVISYIK